MLAISPSETLELREELVVFIQARPSVAYHPTYLAFESPASTKKGELVQESLYLNFIGGFRRTKGRGRVEEVVKYLRLGLTKWLSARAYLELDGFVLLPTIRTGTPLSARYLLASKGVCSVKWYMLAAARAEEPARYA